MTAPYRAGIAARDSAPAGAQALVERDCGLRIGEHLTRDDLHDRYFAGRSDGLTPPTTQRIIAACVPA